MATTSRRSFWFLWMALLLPIGGCAAGGKTRVDSYDGADGAAPTDDGGVGGAHGGGSDGSAGAPDTGSGGSHSGSGGSGGSTGGMGGSPGGMDGGSAGGGGSTGSSGGGGGGTSSCTPGSHGGLALSFGAPVSHSLPRSDNPVYSIATGDIDGNGTLDGVVRLGASAAPCLAVLFGAGDGSIASEVDPLICEIPFDMVAADFDEDGRADLAGAQNLVVRVYLGHGDGSFRLPVDYDLPSSGIRARYLSAVDVDLDGHFDLLTLIDDGSSSESWVAVLRGRGDGSFENPIQTPLGIGEPQPSRFSDLDGDGRPDMVVFGYEDVLHILLGRGDGSFTDVGTYTPPQPDSVVPIDLDGDCAIDLVAKVAGQDGLSVMLGHGDGTFDDPIDYTVSPTADFSNRIFAADFDQDGLTDLYYGDKVLLSRGDGTFFPPAAVPHFTFPLVTDFDGDGKLDIAGITDSYRQWSAVLNTSS